MTSQADTPPASGIIRKKPAVSMKTPPNEAKATGGPLPGVLYKTRSVRIKNREHIFYLFAKNLPAIAAIVWILTQPTGVVEWSAFAAFYVMNVLSMSLGYHRFFMHKSFETSKPMRYAIAILAQLGTFGCLRRWVAEHRRHHGHSDEPGDIHSPYYDDYGRPLSGVKGWKYAHLGWVFNKSITDESVYGRGVAEDSAIMFADKYRIGIFLISTIGLPTLWALSFGATEAIIGTVLIGGFLRSTLALHAIASVNSFRHMYGGKRFESKGEARNNWLVAILTLGEGWHNNHHAHPRLATTSFAWYEVDLTGWVIWALEKTGLIWNVRWAKSPATE